MALTKKYIQTKRYVYENDDFIEKQIEHEKAYIQITNVNGDKTQIKITVTVYKDDTKVDRLTLKTYNFKPSVIDGSTNFIQQGYEYLKTLPEYADAVDC